MARQPRDTPDCANPDSSGGSVQEKALLNVILEKACELFAGESTDQDKQIYVINVIKGKLLESETLQHRANNNSEEPFASSPDLKAELLNAIMGSGCAHADEHAGVEFGNRQGDSRTSY